MLTFAFCGVNKQLLLVTVNLEFQTWVFKLHGTLLGKSIKIESSNSLNHHGKCTCSLDWAWCMFTDTKWRCKTYHPGILCASFSASVLPVGGEELLCQCYTEFARKHCGDITACNHTVHIHAGFTVLFYQSQQVYLPTLVICIWGQFHSFCRILLSFAGTISIHCTAVFLVGMLHFLR